MSVAASASKEFARVGASTFLGIQQREGCRRSVLANLGVLQHGPLASSDCLQEGNYPLELSSLGTHGSRLASPPLRHLASLAGLSLSQMGSLRYASSKQRRPSCQSPGERAASKTAHAAASLSSRRSALGSRAQQSLRRQAGRTSHVQLTTTPVPEQHRSLLQCILQVRKESGLEPEK